MSVLANQSVARALRIMQTLAAGAGGLGVRELARAIGVSPSIAQRLVSTLAEFGFAEQDAGRKYRVGLGAFSVGNTFLSGNSLVRESLDELQRLAEEYQLNAYLGVLRGRSVVYLLALQSSGPIAIKSSPGAETHLHSTALGKALLLGVREPDVARLLGREPYVRLTNRTRTRLAQVLADLKAARRCGYTVSDEENLVGVHAIGAPVRDGSGATVAAVSGALARHEVTRARLPALATLVREAADRISSRLGASCVQPANRSANRHPTERKNS